MNLSNEKKYTIDELCELAGYTRRTIRFYIQEGILEAPAGRGRGGFYFDSHLEKLHQIRSLQEQGLKLSTINHHLEENKSDNDDSIRKIWAKYEIVQGFEINISRDFEKNNSNKIREILKIAKSIIKKAP